MNPASVPPGLSGRRTATPLLLGVLVPALWLRLWIAFGSGLPWGNVDTTYYFLMAERIVIGKPISSFPNGFPLIIAAVHFLCPPARIPAAIIGCNVILSTLLVLLGYGIGRAVHSGPPTVLAAALIAVWPNQLVYAHMLLSEMPATFFLTLGIFLLLRRKAVSGGLSLAAASLIRSTLSPVVFLVFAWMLAFKKGKAQIGLYAAGIAMVFAVNHALLRWQVIAPPTNANPNLLFAIGSSSTAGVRFNADPLTMDQQTHPLRTYVSFACEHPVTFLQQRFSSVWELWGPWPTISNEQPSRNPLIRAVIGLRFVLFVLALIELARHRRSAAHWLLALPILVVTGVHAAFFSTPRFSCPVEPCAIVLSAPLLVCAGRWCLERWQLREKARPMSG